MVLSIYITCVLVLDLCCFVFCCHNCIILENKANDDIRAFETNFNFNVRTLFGNPKDPKVLWFHVVLDLLIWPVWCCCCMPVNNMCNGFYASFNSCSNLQTPKASPIVHI